MSRNGSWKNVPGSFTTVDTEIEIHFESTGFHEDARLYGPPENCSPEEHEDERTLVSATLTFWSATGEHTIKLTKEQQQQIFDAHEKEIDNTEMDDLDVGQYDVDYHGQ